MGKTRRICKKKCKKDTGEVSYFPQCNNFWSENCCRKKKQNISCNECKFRSYKKLTKEDIIKHLRGLSYNESDVIGVYPLLADGTCRFLVFDFDNHEKGSEKNDYVNNDDTWIEEVEAMRKICVLMGTKFI
ncbi:TOTE conflict system archaeo-eukaryotic primase domain-containing protein [Floccifex sp.]|uniref:TOTE conflict system archaeo-eukaryotic primase domain-containing protein n=1 Tax=Floccifex sp. TaxID=2815810 RepID=UPI00387E9E33